MHVLLVNPKFPDSYWSGKYVLPLLRRRNLLPPLSLITIAALLPKEWNCRLVDLNGELLSEEDLHWADVVMLTGMIVQQDSLHQVLGRCRALGVRTVVGGPYATARPEDQELAHHVVVGEAENLVPVLAADLADGRGRHFYKEEKKPNLNLSPLPRFDLLKPNFYHQMAVQFSRGCPFDCEFCDVVMLYGRKPRTKTPDQVIAELEAINSTGFSGDVFFVDDNFVCKRKTTKAMLSELVDWRRRTHAPLEFYTQASMDITDDPDLIDLMTRAGFTKVFLGIETPVEETLRETKKIPNLKRDIVKQVHWLLDRGLDVAGGFILGFDNDRPDIFERMKEFIDKAAIPYAMVGLLVALPNTALYHRLKKEGRLRSDICGNQFGLTNVITKMPADQLLEGYRKILEDLYKPDGFFERSRQNVALWKPVPGSRRTLQLRDLSTVLRLLWAQGIVGSYRRSYWNFLLWVLRHHPSKISYAIHQAAAGHHFIVYTQNVVIPSLTEEARSIANS